MSDVVGKGVGWNVFKNVASQVVTRGLLAVWRFGIAIVIVRQSGVSLYGDYSLVLALLLMMETVVDFGMNESVVRMICQRPEQRLEIVKGLFYAKAILATLGCLLMVFILLILGYSGSMVTAGLVAILGVVAFGGISIFRANFKAQLKMDLEMAAEFISVTALVPLIWYVSRVNPTLPALIGCYVAARFVFLVFCWLFSRANLKGLSLWPPPRNLKFLFSDSLLLAISFMLVQLGMLVNPMVLSKLADSRSVGLFTGSMRFFMLLNMVVYSVTNTSFPLLATYADKSPEAFHRTAQRVFKTVSIIASWAVAFFYVSAGLLLSIMSEEMLEAEGLFRLMSVFAFWQSLAGALGLVIIACKDYSSAIWLTLYSVSAKLVFLLVLVPRFGLEGAAYASMVAECTLLVLASIVVYKKCKISLPWGKVFVVAGVTCANVAIVNALGLFNSVLGALAVILIHPLALLATGIFSISDIRDLLSVITNRFASMRSS